MSLAIIRQLQNLRNWLNTNKDALSVGIIILTFILSALSFSMITRVDALIKENDYTDKVFESKSVDVEFQSKELKNNEFHLSYIIVNNSKRFLNIDTSGLEKGCNIEEAEEKEEKKTYRNPSLKIGSEQKKWLMLELNNKYWGDISIPPESKRIVDFKVEKEDSNTSVPLSFCVEICSDLRSKDDESKCRDEQYLYIYRVDFI